MTNFDHINVVIADDHPMLLQGLESTLIKNGIDVLASAKDGTSALQAIIDHRPTLAIVDVEMPYLTGFAIAEECQKIVPETKFIILSYHKEAQFIVRARNLNISGYVLKEDTSTEIIKCIEHVLKGEFYYSPSIIKENLDHANKHLNRLVSLSPSEKKILKMIAAHMSSQEISEKLHVSERTIEKHRSNIISKLDLSGQVNSLSLWAVEQKSIIMSL
jgi:two-component system, NarL family, nitrate/nitrite response regulator NarL